jgi:acetoin utilization protein AcuB
MTVKEVMSKNPITVDPEMSVESAVALAQNKGVGALPVVENNKLVGIATTNDFFYKLLNPILGIAKPGTRLVISKGGDVKSLQDVLDSVKKAGAKIISFHTIAPIDGKEQDICLHVDKEDVKQLVKDLATKGYTTETIER